MPHVPNSLIVIAVVFCAAWLCLALLRAAKSAFRRPEYRAKPLLTAWEVRALAEISAQLPRGYHACPQVRLADMVEIVERDPGRRRAALSRVACKSVDFAIIATGGRVALVIELDDRSHDRPDRRQRDQLVNAVLAQCGVPILHIRPGTRIEIGRHLRGSHSVVTWRGAA